jgi:hypothetical protein
MLPLSNPPSESGIETRLAVELLKQAAEERRFVMRSYMQAFALYLALAGYGIKELVEAHPPILVAYIIAGLYTALNILAVYAAGRFKSMALHADTQEKRVAKLLGLGDPHSLIWGYGGGIVVVCLGELTTLVITVLRARGQI